MLNIKSPEADRLARQLAQYMGETMTHVITEALREKLLREEGRRAPIELKESLSAISHHCAQLPDQNQQALEKFLAYDQFGLPV